MHLAQHNSFAESPSKLRITSPIKNTDNSFGSPVKKVSGTTNNEEDVFLKKYSNMIDKTYKGPVDGGASSINESKDGILS